MDISFGTKFFQQLCKCAQGNAQYSMEMDWRENGLIKDRWHECWKPFVIDAGRHFRQCQNLTDVRYVCHSKYYLLWGGSSWLFRHADDYKRVFSQCLHGSVRIYIPFFVYVMTNAHILSSCHIFPHSGVKWCGVKWCKFASNEIIYIDDSITTTTLNRDLRIVMISQACDMKLHHMYDSCSDITHVTIATFHMNGATYGGERVRL